MSTAETLQLIKTLKPKLGEKGATDLITYIEEYNAENLVTKADLKTEALTIQSDIKQLEITLRKEINANTWKIIGGIGLLMSIFMAMIKILKF